jgi:gamma-glutamylcyclotransferase (GGCT)/AIG2-like uncharacterized protein YtfP
MRPRRSPPRTTPPALLFVYGTLMRGEALHPVLARVARFVASGHVRGRLVSFGRWPGLYEGAGRVRGELYRLRDLAQLRVVDEKEEGYNFVRRRALVTLPRGRRVRAWVYRCTGPRGTATPIPSGDWRRRPQ